MSWDEQTDDKQGKDEAEQERQNQEAKLVECASCHTRVDPETLKGGLCAPCRVEQGR